MVVTSPTSGTATVLGVTIASGTPVLTFTITNPGANTATGLAFSDDLDAVREFRIVQESLEEIQLQLVVSDDYNAALEQQIEGPFEGRELDGAGPRRLGGARLETKIVG